MVSEESLSQQKRKIVHDIDDLVGNKRLKILNFEDQFHYALNTEKLHCFFRNQSIGILVSTRINPGAKHVIDLMFKKVNAQLSTPTIAIRSRMTNSWI